MEAACPITPVFTTSIGISRNVSERQTTENGNLSTTALQQASVAAALSQGRINAAAGQVLAHQAAMEAGRARQAELARLARIAEWRESRMRANALAGAMRGAALGNRDALRAGLLLQIPSFYLAN